ncbi:MAG: SUKH-3 domain-containing protein [Verrucomicrobiales bacterium]|nr:SUKH-3 domain-containing protein [Verrucomicrobiales bacterium]
MNIESKRLRKALKKIGWKNDRIATNVINEYRSALGPIFSEVAEKFVSEFGGLEIPGRLWIYPDQAKCGIADHAKICSIIRENCCPIASSSYLGDGAIIWIDDMTRFYASDSEGILFIASDVIQFLKVIVLETKRCSPPVYLEERLRKAWEWNNISEPKN